MCDKRDRDAGKPSLTQLFYLKCREEDKQLFPARRRERMQRWTAEQCIIPHQQSGAEGSGPHVVKTGPLCSGILIIEVRQRRAIQRGSVRHLQLHASLRRNM